MTRRVSVSANLLVITTMLALLLPAGLAAPLTVRAADPEVISSVDFDDGHFTVRPSNTEPLLRLNLEALSEPLMEEKRDEVLAVIRNR